VPTSKIKGLWHLS